MRINKFLSTLKERFQNNSDFIVKNFDFYRDQITLVYLQHICDEKKIKDDIIQPILLCETEKKYLLHLLSLPNCETLQSEDDWNELLFAGNVYVVLADRILRIKATSEINSEPRETSVEMSVQGPQMGLSEDLATNITMVRKRYPSKGLVTEKQKVGSLSKTDIALMYDVDYVQEEVLQDLKERLGEIKIDMIQAAGQLQNALTRGKYHLFPTMMITERPDRIALNLSQGKVAIFVSGTPFALILPAVFFDFISAMDDLYQAYWIKKMLILLRYVGVFVTLVLPASYVAIASFNPEIVRSQLALTIAGSRAAVPYPSFLEVIFMMLVVEMLVEASIRLPNVIGATATTVGGLILGQAAQQAELVSSIMIIITAFVAIANFTIPVNAMSFAIRVTRYPLLLLASCLGIIGLVGGLIVIICYLVNLRSFGKPYLAIYWGSTKEIETISEDSKGE
jgi:hypothetical protein